jgi:hypothetical protein
VYRNLVFLRFCKSCALLLFATMLGIQALAQPSVLSNGEWYKITIPKTGVYKLDYNQLKRLGINVDAIDPRTIKIYGNPGGMLPQPNATERPNDLLQNAILVQGESDGVFNTSDVVFFYAEGADAQAYDPQRAIMKYEYNLYADKNYHFLTVGGEQGKRIRQAEQVTATVRIDQFEDVVHHELTKYNLLKSGREWLGERFDNSGEQVIKIDVEGIVQGSIVKLVSDVAAYSLQGSVFTLSMNNVLVGEQPVDSVPNYQYGDKADHKRDTFLLSADAMAMPNRISQEIKYTFSKGSSSNATGYLDFFTITSKRKLAVYGSQTLFRSSQSTQQASTIFNVANSSDNTQVWDVSNSTEPIVHTLFNGAFTASTETLKDFIVVNEAFAPEAIAKIDNQNLHALSSTEFLIITDDGLKPEAERLAQHRSSHSNMLATVVTVNQVYNEFSSGRQDVTAIRDFVRHVKNLYPTALKYVLMFGKGSYDYKNALRDNVNRVPTYEARNSVNPLSTFSSDDFFALLDANEGEWKECNNCGATADLNANLDIGIGRIPAKNTEQAKNTVDKIIDYDTKSTGQGSWQSLITFVADDGDNNLHQDDADQLATELEAAPSSIFSAKKIYLDSYEQISRPAGQIAPDVSTAIKNVLNEGSLIINYSGHGNEYVWAQERVLDELLIVNTDNKRLPFLVTATCEFGRHDDPVVSSVAEISLLRKEHGAIGLLSTTRPVYANNNFVLNRAFYEVLLTKNNGHYQAVGDVFRQTKNNSLIGIANRNFSLLGDPSMTLGFPEETITIETIETSEADDTLKASSTVTLRGSVHKPDGATDVGFNGTLEATVFDKQVAYKTLGNENIPFTYKQWSTLLFKGQGKVKDGLFELEFIVPKNIAYAVGDGRISLFATSATQTAAGVATVKVGGSASSFVPDTTPPTLRAYLNDTTFVNGGLVAADAKLVVRLADESGINISNIGIGNDLVAVLDDDQVFELNNHYLADVDDFTKGTVTYPLTGLLPGKHRLHVQAWDTHNNSNQTFVDFFVTDGKAMIIEEFGNYPNPFRGESMLFFTHNTAGDDVEAELVVYNPQGGQVMKETFFVESTAYRVDLASIKSTDLPAGIYLAHLSVRSANTGFRAKASAKLIIAN